MNMFLYYKNNELKEKANFYLGGLPLLSLT